MSNAYLNGSPETLISVNRRVVTSGGLRGIYLPSLDRLRPPVPELAQPEDNSFYVDNGEIFTWQPAHRYRVTTGHWRKTFGPDCVSVNSITGQVRFNTSLMPLVQGYRQDQSVHIGVELSNITGVSETVIIVHIGKEPDNIHRVGPGRTHETLVSLAESGSFQPGDTVVVDSGTYTGLSNTLCFREGQTGPQLPGGSDQRYTNIMSRIPGEWVFDGQWTIQSAIYIYGDEPTLDWDNTWVGAVNRNWTMVSGLKTVRCTADSIGAAFCAYIVVRNCWPGDGAYYSSTHNVTNMSFVRCHDVLFEDCAPYGYGRYNVSSYESWNVVFRRCQARHTPYWGREPAASGFSFYRARNSTAQNCWVLDAQLEEFWMPQGQATQYTTDAFQLASTGVYSYSYGNRLMRCGAVRIGTGFMHSAAYGLTAGQWGLTAIDCAGHDFVIGNGKSSQHAIMTGYKGRMYNSSMSKLRWLSGTNADGVIIQGDAKELYDVLFHDIGVDAAGAILPGLAFYSQWGNVGATVRAERVSLGNFAGAKFGGAAIGYESSLTEVSPLIIVGSLENGLQYIGRVEPGSALDASGIGARNTLKNIGVQGTYLNDPDFETEPGSYTFPMPGHRVTHKMYNEYTYDEPLSGLPIFSGNTGIGAADEDAAYWVHSRLRASVFPLHVDAQAFDDDGVEKVRVSWLRHPDKYKKQYLGYKIYRNNDSTPFAVVTGEETDCTDPAPVDIGTDIYTVVGMHAQDGDSGRSHPVSAKAA